MSYDKFALRCGTDIKFFEPYFDGHKVAVKSDVELEEDYDQKAIEHISNISSITVAPYEDRGIQLNFTPITDEIFLQEISFNKTKVRIQLLCNEPGAGSDLVIVNPEWHKYGTGHLNRSRRNQKGVIIGFSNFQNGQICHMRKPRSHQSQFYGISWKDLTAEELRRGYVILDNILQVCDSRSYRSPSIPIELDNGIDNWIEGRQGDRIISAELYIPCLYKSNSDTFSYERSGGRKIASNCIFANPNLQDAYGINCLSLNSNVFRLIEIEQELE